MSGVVESGGPGGPYSSSTVSNYVAHGTNAVVGTFLGLLAVTGLICLFSYLHQAAEAVGHANSSVAINWFVPDVGTASIEEGLVPIPVENRWQPLDASRIYAAAGIGAREYPRRRPPSLSSHLRGPDVTTGSDRAIGVRSSSPRCGRAWL